MANASSEDSIRAVEEDAVHFKKFFLFNVSGLYLIQGSAVTSAVDHHSKI